MCRLLENCLLFIILLNFSTADANQIFQAVCVDKSVHCKRKSHLCHSNAFLKSMRTLCKKTCNLCGDNDGEEIWEAQDENEPEIEKEVLESEEDEENEPDGPTYPEPGTDIDELEVTETIPETFPTLATSTSIISNEWKQPVCMDLSAECAGKSYLCHQHDYVELMDKYCAKTCGFCRPPVNLHLSKSNRNSRQFGGSGTRNQMNIWECQDNAPDCHKSLCANRSYQYLVQSLCKKTCSLCYLNNSS